MLEWVRSVGERFSPEDYLFWTRIQGALWTAADLVIVLALLLTCNVVREYLGRRKHRISFIIVGLTAVLALFLPVAASGAAIFRLELLITVPHFIIILYLCLYDAPVAAEALARRLGEPVGKEKADLGKA